MGPLTAHQWRKQLTIKAVAPNREQSEILLETYVQQSRHANSHHILKVRH